MDERSLSEPSRQFAPRTPDEWISFGRLLLAPVLWIPAILRKPRLVAVGILLSAVSDMADGFVARLLGSRSDFSRQLDAVADSAVMLSAIGWLALARPGSVRPLRVTLAVLGAVAGLLLSVQWRRYHMLGALHMDSARAAAVVGHIYALLVLWCGTAPRALLRLFQFLVAGAAVESASVILGGYDPNDRSAIPLLHRLLRTKHG